ncbi:MAG: DUF4124 domain-containing protein [Ectothiorhodospiraceae bacterium]|jgi:hypothetical protein
MPREVLIKSTLSLLILLASAPLPAATVYRWTDDMGVTHFTEDAPPPGTRSRAIHVQSARSGNPGASPRVRQIRCRDFRGALSQLDALDHVSESERNQWQSARSRARTGIGKWCDD